MKYSITISGLIVSVLATLVKDAGFSIDHESLKITIATVVQLSGVVMVYWGRFRAGGMNWLGMKK